MIRHYRKQLNMAICTALLCGCYPAPPSQTASNPIELPKVTGVHGETISDIAYGPLERNVLDLYLPAERANAPVVLFVHGGRWMRNDKSQIQLHDRAAQLTKAGFVVVSINYTYSTQALWPQQLDDTLAAINWVQTNAATYGYDGNSIALWGQSSGAHMVLMIMAEQASEDNSPVKAVIAWYPPTDLKTIASDRSMDDVPDRAGGDDGPTPEELLLGQSPVENPELGDKASPLWALGRVPDTRALPPLLLVHGTQDSVVSPLQTRALFAMFSERGVSQNVTLRWVEGASHGGPLFDAEVEPAIAFLTALLPPKRPSAQSAEK